MRLRTPRKRSVTFAALLTLALAAPLTASTNATASPPARASTATVDEDIRQYEIHGPSTVSDRNAVAATGVSLDEVQREEGPLDAYSRVVTEVARRLAPSVANLRVSRRIARGVRQKRRRCNSRAGLPSPIADATWITGAAAEWDEAWVLGWISASEWAGESQLVWE